MTADRSGKPPPLMFLVFNNWNYTHLVSFTCISQSTFVVCGNHHAKCSMFVGQFTVTNCLSPRGDWNKQIDGFKKNGRFYNSFTTAVTPSVKTYLPQIHETGTEHLIDNGQTATRRSHWRDRLQGGCDWFLDHFLLLYTDDNVFEKFDWIQFNSCIGWQIFFAYLCLI